MLGIWVWYLVGELRFDMPQVLQKKIFFLVNFKKFKKAAFQFSKKALRLSCDSGFPWFCCDMQDKQGFSLLA